MELGIRGKAALVTRASKGLARGIVSALVAEGARVAVTSRLGAVALRDTH